MCLVLVFLGSVIAAPPKDQNIDLVEVLLTEEVVQLIRNEYSLSLKCKVKEMSESTTVSFIIAKMS